MSSYPIFHRWSTRLIALVEAETYPQALELVVARRVKMLYAGLKGVRVPGAVLSEGDFRGADLSHADLAGINLYKADLRAASLLETNLRQAILKTADLRQADLRGADLRYASLEGASLWGLTSAVPCSPEHTLTERSWTGDGAPLQWSCCARM